MIEEKDKKVKELQDNIAAVQFTPQSKMGKMLMTKCRTLQEENEEIGNQAAEGKVPSCYMYQVFFVISLDLDPFPYRLLNFFFLRES